MKITTTKISRPPKILVYGQQGLGKSSLAAEMPKPIFIQTTDGLEGLGVQAFDLCKCAEDVRQQLEWVLTQPHDFKTLVIDTVGWLEKLIHAEVCAQLKIGYMTEASFKSYPLAKDKLLEMKKLWDRINVERKMYVMLLGHASLKKFEDPTLASYDRYELDMNEKCADILLQDSDAVGFFNTKIQTKTESGAFGAEAIKASGSGRRFIYFDPRPAFFAKDHNYGLPAEVELPKGKSWETLFEFIKAKFASQRTGNLAEVAAEKAARDAAKEVAAEVAKEEVA